MYLKKSKNRQGRIYLSIVDGYYDPITKNTKQINVEKIGFLDEMEKQYKDPIAHFNLRVEELKRQKEEKKKQQDPLHIPVSLNKEIDESQIYTKNFGYIILSFLYHSLHIHDFLNNRQRTRNFAFIANNIMKNLVYSRLLYPCSKRATYDLKDLYFEGADYSRQDVYRFLSFLSDHEEAYLLHLNDWIRSEPGRDDRLLYYDVSNYYFETEIADTLKKRGYSKENRRKPIIQMGLFIDNLGLPLMYDLYPGNTTDADTFRPSFKAVKDKYGVKKTIVVADKGISIADNLWYIKTAKDGYVVSLSIRGGSDDLKDFVISHEGYVWKDQEKTFKSKSAQCKRKISVTKQGEEDKPKKKRKRIDVEVEEKHVAFYSEKYARRSKAKREELIAKAEQLISDPGRYNQATHYGATAYIENIKIDKNEKIVDTKQKLRLNRELIKEQEKFDGYYLIATSEIDMPDEEIIHTYHALWRIEESFKLTKSQLETRPVYVRSEEHIRAHFMICFTALLISRLLEYKMDKKHSIKKMLIALKNCTCTHRFENIFLFHESNDVLKEIGKEFGVSLVDEARTLGDIKKTIASSKKV